MVRAVVFFAMHRAAALTLIVGLVLAGCHAAPPAVFPNAPVVLISVDTLRSDHLPTYGYKGVETPALDALARDAIVFEHAYSHCPLTLPSHLSILTGLTPAQHGVRDNLGYRLDADAHPTLGRVLKGRGYATGGAVSAYVLRRATGVADGFDAYDDAVGSGEPGLAASLVRRAGAETARRALAWLRTVEDRPFLLFLHLYEPHAPYEPPEMQRRRYGNTYDGEVAAADAVVGDVVAALKRDGVYDRALVVFLSDHGEGLGDHGEQEHGILLYREALQVPLLVKLPGAARGGTRIDRPVGLVDVLPTVLGVVGVARPAGLAGASLLAETAPSAGERRIASETWYPRIHLGWSDLRSLIDGRYHYIDGPRPELYDVEADAAETQDAVAARVAIAAAMRDALRAQGDAFAAPAPVDGETAERMRSLGYLSGTAPPPAAGAPLPNPRDVIGAHERLETAFRAARAGDDRAAATALQAILADNPRSFDAQWGLATSLARLGRLEDAVAAYRKAMALSPTLAAPTALDLARVVAGRDPRRALAVLEEVRGGSASPVQGLEAMRGDLLAKAGRYADAEGAFRAEIAAFPKGTRAYANLAAVMTLAGRPRTDVRATVAAMVAASPDGETRRLAAETLAFLGDAEGAAAWRSGL